MEGNSLTVTEKLNSPTLDKSIISPIVQDIKAKLGIFAKVTFCFAGRQANIIAHALAGE
ncbi:hypothetical protein Goklo_000077, partial [Gossypium klotzschianum]|nr:hypothetical protein [Gossypium klotzschianum]